MNIQKSFSESSSAGPGAKGKLYLVATPIGNLEDMTFRAIRILKEVHWIAAEDTRQTRKLLTHFDIPSRTISYHEHNKQASGAELIRKLLAGESVAVVSDAGIPAISDPGFDLIQLAIHNSIAVVPIPGANAALSALIVSGLSTDRFLYAGFLPRTKKKLIEELEKLKAREETLIFYESPHRLDKTLQHIFEQWGDRQVALARELTKKYEEIWRGTVSQSLSWVKELAPRGEYCIVIEGRTTVEDILVRETMWDQMSLTEHVEYYFKQSGNRKEAMKKVAVDRKVSRRDVYNDLLKNP
ncbi:MAG TPA: 16S rRNA (cytidine(1402)-2'-O)-methyltransferase [Bacilli bacterium]